MKKTKIVCTLGPASDNKIVIKKLIKGGMDVARINLSHGNQEMHKSYVDLIRSLDRTMPIIADLKGAEIRVNGLKKPVEIKKGNIVRISGLNKNGILVSYKNIHRAVKTGSLILLDDGLIKLKVESVKNKIIYCKALNSNILKNNKKVTIPKAKIYIKFPSKADIEDINFAVKNNIEFIAVSFVRTKSDIDKVRKMIKRSKINIITKVETAEAVENFKEILSVSDGIMIARGDLKLIVFL